MTLYNVCDYTREEKWLATALAEANLAIQADDRIVAQEFAHLWATQVVERLQLDQTSVWKFYKRTLAARWFGKPESKSFLPNWSPEQALQYASQFTDRSIRFSLFPLDIACHAESIRLPLEQRDKWYAILLEADNSTHMEMFPEQRQEALCFRRFSTLFQDEVYYEIGIGQAMYVFEAERGAHPLILASRMERPSPFLLEVRQPTRASGTAPLTIAELTENAQVFVSSSDDLLSYQCFCLCRFLGLDYVSIEGYFDPLSSARVVVDLDLPLDIVFML